MAGNRDEIKVCDLAESEVIVGDVEGDWVDAVVFEG